MPRMFKRRITKAQRAAFCALRLVDLTFQESVDIVGVLARLMAAYLPADWREKCVPRGKWSGQLLEDLKLAYEDPKARVTTIARLFDTSPRMISLLARRHEWTPKKRGRRRNPKGIRAMSRMQRSTYRKVRSTQGREAALQAAFQ